MKAKDLSLLKEQYDHYRSMGDNVKATEVSEQMELIQNALDAKTDELVSELMRSARINPQHN